MAPSPMHEAMTWLLEELVAQLPAAVVRRNEALPETVPPGGYVVLYDPEGDDDVDREDMIGVPASYSFHTMVGVGLYVQNSDDGVRTEQLQVLAQAVLGVLEGDRTMGGAVSISQPQPAQYAHNQPAVGTVPVGRMAFSLLLVYDTSNPLG
jgi:hypothetical protein